MNYLLDTCAVSDFFKKLPSTVKHFERVMPKQIHISTVSVMEIEYGLKLNSDKEKKLRTLWNALLEEIQTVAFSKFCAKASADIRGDLKVLGQPVGSYDILIAGTAVAHDYIVVTSNISEFKRIPKVLFENWRDI